MGRNRYGPRKRVTAIAARPSTHVRTSFFTAPLATHLPHSYLCYSKSFTTPRTIAHTKRKTNADLHAHSLATTATWFSPHYNLRTDWLWLAGWMADRWRTASPAHPPARCLPCLPLPPLPLFQARLPAGLSGQRQAARAQPASAPAAPHRTVGRLACRGCLLARSTLRTPACFLSVLRDSPIHGLRKWLV